MSDLIGDLLDVTRIETGTLHVFAELTVDYAERRVTLAGQPVG